MATTRGQYCELIQRALSGGFPSDDTEITINLINIYLGPAIAYAAKTNYKESIQLDGVESISDAFYASFSNISITKESGLSYLYNATLPQAPVGVGVGWDIPSFMLTTGSGKKIFAYPISAREVPFLYEGENGCDEVYFWMNQNIASLHSCKDISRYKASIRMIISQSNDLNSIITVPDGYMPVVIDYIAKTLGIQLQMNFDVSSDGVPSTQVK